WHVVLAEQRLRQAQDSAGFLPQLRRRGRKWIDRRGRCAPGLIPVGEVDVKRRRHELTVLVEALHGDLIRPLDRDDLDEAQPVGWSRGCPAVPEKRLAGGHARLRETPPRFSLVSVFYILEFYGHSGSFCDGLNIGGSALIADDRSVT